MVADVIPGGSRAISYRNHAAATLRLGMPLVGAQLAQISIQTTDTVMIGWLGARDLAAGVLGAQSFFVTLMLGAGFAYAIIPMVAQAEGAGDLKAARRFARMGFWLTTFYAALLMIGLWNLEAVLLLLGQEPELAAMAGSYIRIMQWSLFPALYMFVLRSFLSALEHTRIVLAATVFAAITNGLLNYAFIFGNWGAPALGLDGAAIASLVSTFAGFAAMLAYCLIVPALKRYEILVRLWRADWPALRELFQLGWPISLTIVAEVGLFAASSVMMGWIGPLELAAHGIALQIASLVFMIPLGLASAATIRVGNACGRGDMVNLQRAAITALVIATAIAVISALVFISFPAALVSLFLEQDHADSARVLVYGVAFLAVAASFQLFDSVQAVAIGLLRGLKDMRIPMIYAVISYWIAGMPLAYFLAFIVGMGGVGIWIGLASGLALAALLLTQRFFRKIAAGQASQQV
jgi:multidrug resistance protein, MATE family